MDEAKDGVSERELDDTRSGTGLPNARFLRVTREATG